jgi:Protein of unknown function (DUF982)
MNKQWWSNPVTFETGTASFRTIANTEEASHFLLNHWPVQGGKKHLQARNVCLAVLAGERPPDDARTAFIEAAQEVAICVSR